MNMNQRPFCGAIPATLAAGALFGLYASVTGLDADLGQSPTLLVATVTVFLAPALVAIAFRALLSYVAQRRADERAARDVMQTVAPFEAESIPLAAAVYAALPAVMPAPAPAPAPAHAPAYGAAAATILPRDADMPAVRVAGPLATAADVHSLTEVKVERRQRERRAAERRDKDRDSAFAS